MAQGLGTVEANEGDFQSFDGWTHAALHYRQSPSEHYERDLPDGSIEIYGQITTCQGHRLFFLTSAIDPQGNTTTLNYDPNAAANGLAILTSVVAPTGGVSSQASQLTISYDTANPLLIAKVTRSVDGLAASFEYTNGQLTSITDPIGITSYYHYSEGTAFIDTMTTPYGNTTFNSQDGPDHLEADLTTPPDVTNPLGLKERVEYWQTVATGLMPSEVAVPTVTNVTFDTNLNTANSFYWNRRAMADLGATSPDSATGYYYAQITHWGQSDTGSIAVPLSTKNTLEARVWYSYQYQAGAISGAVNPNNIDLTIGSSSTSPSVTARTLDSGALQVSFASYNPNGLILQSTDPLGRVTNYSYDANNIDLLSVMQKNGAGADTLSTMSNYTMHLPQTIVDAAGQTTSLTYNPSTGQLTSRTVTVGGTAQTTTMGYTGPGGTGTGTYLTSVTGPIAGAVTYYTYDAANRVNAVTDSESYTVRTGYDNLDRPTVVTYPDGSTDTTAYHILDVDHTTDRQGRTTQNTYDSIRQLLTTMDPQGRITKYGWCTCGALASLTDANANTTQWGLDREGRVISKTYADGTSDTYAYETNSTRLSAMTNANSYASLYTYNVDNTLARTSYSGTNTPAVSFTYDPAYNRVTSMVDGTGTNSYTYNPVNGALGAGRLAAVTVPIYGTGHSATVSYKTSTGAAGYDELGRVTSRNIDNTNFVGTTYDALGRITNVTNALAPASPGFQYGYVNTPNPSFRVASVTYPSSTGLSMTNSYYGNSIGDGTGNEDERLSEIKNMSGTNQISDFKYTYKPVGTIATWTQQTNSTSAAVTNTITYDNADQLTKYAQSGASTNSYGYYYDPAGNRLSETVNSATTAAGRFNPVNQLTSRTTSPTSTNVVGYTSAAITNATVNAVPATITGSGFTNFSASVAMPSGTNIVSVVALPTAVGASLTTQRYQIVTTGTAPTVLTYDSCGNVTKDENGNTYQWDALNRLIRITYYPSTAFTTFAYDGLSRRTQIAEYNSSHALTSTKNYLWVGSEIAEERDTSNNVTKQFFPQGEQQAGMNYYYTRDHLGSVREMLNSSGTIVARYSYDPYGRTTLLSGSNVATKQYAGYYAHQASGLYLTKYRAYDPNTARWLSRDPIAERGGINLYEYVGDNPINLLDQLGLGTWIFLVSPVDAIHRDYVNVTYIMSDDEKKCCTGVDVQRFVKYWGKAGSWGGLAWAPDGSVGGYTDRYGGAHAEGDNPGGSGQNIVDAAGFGDGSGTDVPTIVPQSVLFRWDAVCTGGKLKGKTLSSIQRTYTSSGYHGTMTAP